MQLFSCSPRKRPRRLEIDDIPHGVARHNRSRRRCSPSESPLRRRREKMAPTDPQSGIVLPISLGGLSCRHREIQVSRRRSPPGMSSRLTVGMLTMVDVNPNAPAVQIPTFYDARPFEEAIAHGHGEVPFTADNEVLYFPDKTGTTGGAFSGVHCISDITKFLSDRSRAQRLNPITWMSDGSLESASDFAHSDSPATTSSSASY